MPHSKEDYKKALQSKHWKSLKQQIYKDCEGRCQRCVKKPHETVFFNDLPNGTTVRHVLDVPVRPQKIWNLELHHKHYDTLGHEGPEDVELLCHACHAKADREYVITKSVNTFCRNYYKNHNRMPTAQDVHSFVNRVVVPKLNRKQAWQRRTRNRTTSRKP